jgi:hypothetical protein
MNELVFLDPNDLNEIPFTSYIQANAWATRFQPHVDELLTPIDLQRAMQSV